MLGFVEQGGRRAALTTGRHAAEWVAGRFRSYAYINWPPVSRLIFVCKGNICRSAFAHRLALRYAAGLTIASAGLEASAGDLADARTAHIAAERGVDMDPHRATRIEDIAVTDRDLFIAFEPPHAEELSRRVKHSGCSAQVTLLGLWSSSPWRVYIHDPYALSEQYFRCCFERIHKGLLGLVSDRMRARRPAPRGW